MRKILKGAVVLLIAVAMVFSSVAIAKTQTKESTIELSTANQGSATGSRGGIVWDNGMEYGGLYSTQQDDVYPYDCYLADDFHFDEDTEVGDVHWIGGYWNGDPAPFDWCISFMLDDGSGEAPEGHPLQPTYAGPFCFAWDEIVKEDLGGGYYSMSVDLPEIITFPGCIKFWISIWGVGIFPPQSGWGFHTDPVQLSPAVWGSDFWGYPYWTPGFEIQGADHDQCFQLTGPTQCEPSIDVEKYVWDEKNQDWVDADTETEALDVPICNEVTFKIVIRNDGNSPLYYINMSDHMHDSLKFIRADPEPGDVWYDETNSEWRMWWYFPGPLKPSETIEITVIAHVEGPKCSYDYNWVLVGAVCEHGDYVEDEDTCWVHATGGSRTFQSPLLNFLQSHPNMFPIVQLLLQRLGL